MTLPLTELNKLIEGSTPGPWTEDDEENLYIVSRTALPNALRVIAECKKALKGVNSRLFNEQNSAQNRLMSAYDVAHKALSRIAAFEANVLQPTTGDDK